MVGMESVRRAGWCGACGEPVRIGETCCGEWIGWVGPDGLGWHDQREHDVAVGAGQMTDARRHGTGVPDWIFELPGDVFLECVRAADTTDLLARAYDEDWPDWMLRLYLRRLA